MIVFWCGLSRLECKRAPRYVFLIRGEKWVGWWRGGARGRLYVSVNWIFDSIQFALHCLSLLVGFYYPFLHIYITLWKRLRIGIRMRV